MKNILIILFVSTLSSCSTITSNTWILVDDFEQGNLADWHIIDTKNDTKPFVLNPQVTKIIKNKENHFLLKKPAEDGVIGNRKALTFKQLPIAVPVGKIYTFYTEIMVDSFPNNHAFGISNLTAEQIKKQAYNAFEPTLRVTDKFESNGYKNDGTLMVKVDSNNKYRQYENIQNYAEGRSATPISAGSWYQIWYVVNNKKVVNGGQSYDVYIQGGEFIKQTQVYRNADFRMKRELPLIYFFANSNTGSNKKPYGNGGLNYDNIFMSPGVNLSLPR
jgi:hypothetical protein